jgi:hypothetical protein
MLSSCGSDGNDAFVSHSVLANESITPHEEVRIALTRFKDAIQDQDIDAVLESDSARYASDDAVGMDGLRAMWDRISRSGFAADLELDIDGSVAEVAFFDNSGEISCTNIDTPCDRPQPYVSLLMENEEGRCWLITGTPTRDQRIAASGPPGNHARRPSGPHRRTGELWRVDPPTR